MQRQMMIEGFLDYLRYELRRSPLTVKNYADDLRAFERFFKNLNGQISWESVDGDVIRDWMESMMDRGNRAASVNRRLSALRSLYHFALVRHLIDKDPAHGIEAPKREKPLPLFLKENDMDRLLDETAWGTDYVDVRDRTIIMTFYETGVRLSELIGLTDGDIDWTGRQLKVTGKGNKQRIIPFGEELSEALSHLIQVRDSEVESLDDALFLTSRGRRMSQSQVRSEVKRRLAGACTLKKLSPHVLRHTFATAMLNHGATIESVKRLLGHESVSTTEIYTHTTFEQLKRVYQDAHPRA